MNRHYAARWGWLGAVVIVSTNVPGCSDRTLPPYGQLRLRIDTDAPIPAVVSRLRIDVFADGDTWVESRDVSLPDRTTWPVSFTVFTPNTTRDAPVRVRLRAYPAGALRDYRGERFVPPPPAEAPPGSMPIEPAATGAPRLLKDGADVTPPDEPLPGLTIDRLVATTLREGDVVESFVALRIECAGTMADRAGDRTCVDRRATLVPTPDASPGDARVAEAPWAALLARDLRFLPAPRPDEVAVAGGVLVLGSREPGVRFARAGVGIDAEPERVFVVPPTLVMREEVTVARFRQALAEGFSPPDALFFNDEPGFAFDGARNGRGCTLSRTPFHGSDSREEMAVSCMSWHTARAFCKYIGGDLPSEAAFEWLATGSGRPRKTAFPWGDATPSCSDVVFGRLSNLATPTPCGGAMGPRGPLPVTAGPLDTSPERVHGLLGGVHEWVRDAYYPYDAACWARAPLYDPQCEGDGDVVVRGSAWSSEELASGALRVTEPAGLMAIDVGFRCVRR